jgi:NDP-sugar pyrophosphorylase family protein
VEDHPLGRGGALKLGFEKVPAEEPLVIATNGDVISEQPVDEIVEAHKKAGAVATVMLTKLVSPYGLVESDEEGWIREFREKPPLPYWLNAGVYVLTPEFFPLCPEEGDHEDSTFPLLAEQRRLLGFKSERYWKSVDSVKDMNEVAERLRQVHA